MGPMGGLMFVVNASSIGFAASLALRPESKRSRFAVLPRRPCHRYHLAMSSISEQSCA